VNERRDFMKSGIVVIDKDQNKTSRDIVNEICKQFQTKKVGHTGTLDPLATGVLVVAINEGTKIIEFLESDEKEYIAEAEQIVPKYSAVHVNGKRLYEYARENQEVTLPSKNIEIKAIQLLEIRSENNHQIFSFQTTVSKGTYIRSLIRDIGEKLGSPCIMKSLQRTRQGIFQLEQAKKVSDIESKDIISLKDALASYPSIIISEKTTIKNSKRLSTSKNDRNQDLFTRFERSSLSNLYSY